MKDIENGVINSVTEMILGRSVVLNPDVIERIATWATLKALCFDLIAESPRFSSDEDFVRLHTQKSPAPGLLVWTAQYEGDPNDFGQFSVLPSFDDVDERQRAHSFKLYLVLGAFALDITFTPLAKISAGPMHGRPVESGYYKALWPMSADLSWPPPLSLNSESYAVFSRQDLYPPILRKQ